MLIYIALENGRPHRRDSLATLLWGEQPQELAFNNLRKTLHRLRQTLQAESGERDTTLLLVTPKEVRWNPAVSLRIDLEAFTRNVARSHNHAHRRAESCLLCHDWLETAVSHYRGHFLENFSPGNCLDFEEWASVHRESLRIQALEALTRLIRHYEALDNWQKAAELARRLAIVEPWPSNWPPPGPRGWNRRKF